MKIKAETEEDLAFVALAQQTDTEHALSMIMQRCGVQCPRLLFLHMIYHELAVNKSAVDRDMKIIRQTGRFKALHLPFGATYTLIAVIASENYIQDLHNSFPLCDWVGKFATWLQKSSSVSASASELPLSPSELEHLRAAGFLRSRELSHLDIDNSDLFWVSHPSLGTIVQQLRAAEKDVLTALRRTRFKELSESQFHALFASSSSQLHAAKRRKKAINVADLYARSIAKPNRSSGSTLPSHYHLLDLLGRNVLQAVNAPGGKESVLRLA
jgi:hypothetical protein